MAAKFAQWQQHPFIYDDDKMLTYFFQQSPVHIY